MQSQSAQRIAAIDRSVGLSRVPLLFLFDPRTRYAPPVRAESSGVLPGKPVSLPCRESALSCPLPQLLSAVLFGAGVPTLLGILFRREHTGTGLSHRLAVFRIMLPTFSQFFEVRPIELCERRLPTTACPL